MSPADVENDPLISGPERAVSSSVSEATPLLPPLADSVKKPWYSIERYSTTPAIYIIPVVLGARLANSVPTSTTVYVIQQVVCRLYYQNNEPGRIPPGGPLSDDLCMAPGVQQEFSTLISLLGVLNGIACMIGYSALNYFSSRYGRKPAILLLLVIGLSSNIFLLISQMDENWELEMLVLWVLCDSFASAFLMLFLATTYVFDLVKTENRSSFLSTMYGCGILGSAVSFGFGGELTTRTHNILPVFRLAAIIHLVVLTFTFFFLPESFTKEKRDELRRRHASEEPQNTRKSLLQSLVSKVKMIFAPLRGLKPKYNEHTGRRNWRLFFCTLHALLIEISTNYGPSLLVIYLTAKFKFKPDQTGFFLAFLCLSYAFTTIILVPAVIPLLRPLYRRKASRQHHLADSELPDQDTVSDSTDHLDIHIAVFSLIVEAIGYILFSFTTTITGQYISVFIISLGGGAKAVFRSVVAASVEPLKQGETLAAVEMVASIGMVISPLYMGAVFSATIISIPTLIFYTNGLITVLGVFVLFLIKDADRYTSKLPSPQEVDIE